MALPGIRLTVVDGNLGLVDSTADKPLVAGPCTLGTANTLYTFSQPSAVVAQLGRGQAVTAACHILEVMAQNGGGSVDVFVTAASVASANSAITKSGGGPTVTVSGTPNDFYSVIGRIRTGGALGAGTWDFSLDGGKNYGDVRTIPSGGTFVLPGTGDTLTFPSGTYVAGETYSFTTTPPTFNSTNLTAAITALLLLNDRWKFIVWAGMAADGTTAASLASAIAGHMTSLANDSRLTRALVDMGADTASNSNTAFEAVEDLRLACYYGKTRILCANPLEGFREPEVPNIYLAAARIASITRGTNSGWKGGGKLQRAGTSTSFNEAKQGETFHNKKCNTVRTYVGSPGKFYLVNGLLKSPAGSDFRYLHWGLAFDLACETTLDALLPYVNASLRVKTDGSGTIHPLDAAAINKKVNAFLRTAVLDPMTEQGFRGFFSAAEFKVDETWNILTSKTLRGDLRCVPLANTEIVDLTAGLFTSLTTAEPTDDQEEAA